VMALGLLFGFHLSFHGVGYCIAWRWYTIAGWEIRVENFRGLSMVCAFQSIRTSRDQATNTI
jgi:hypothetical protein